MDSPTVCSLSTRSLEQAHNRPRADVGAIGEDAPTSVESRVDRNYKISRALEMHEMCYSLKMNRLACSGLSILFGSTLSPASGKRRPLADRTDNTIHRSPLCYRKHQ